MFKQKNINSQITDEFYKKNNKNTDKKNDSAANQTYFG